jgi:hypothetical protein
MTLPTQADLRPVDPILTNFALAYMQAENRFVARRAAVPVPVPEPSGTYFVFDKKYWFSDEMQRRSPGAPFAEGGYGMSTDTFATEQWALSKPVADEDVSASQVPGESLVTTATKWLSGRALIRTERLFSPLMATGVWTNGTAGATKWSNSTTSTPVSDIRTAKRTISQLTGFTPNLMICGEIVEDRLIVNQDITDRMKYTQSATVETVRGALAALLGIGQILVAQAIYNSANEGQTASMSPIVDDDALICYQDPSAGVQGATAFKMFHWLPGGGLGGVRQYYSDERDATVVKEKMQLVFKKVSADLGYFFSDVTD